MSRLETGELLRYIPGLCQNCNGQVFIPADSVGPDAKLDELFMRKLLNRDRTAHVCFPHRRRKVDFTFDERSLDRLEKIIAQGHAPTAEMVVPPRHVLCPIDKSPMLHDSDHELRLTTREGTAILRNVCENCMSRLMTFLKSQGWMR